MEQCMSIYIHETMDEQIYRLDSKSWGGEAPWLPKSARKKYHPDD